MRKIIRYVKDYQRKHFDGKLYLVIGIFLVVLVAFNYALDFENTYIDLPNVDSIQFTKMFFWMMFPFVSITYIIKWFGKDVHINRNYWIAVVIAFIILGLDRTYSGFYYLLDGFTKVDRHFYFKSVSSSSSIFITVIPMILIYKIIDHEYPRHYYGLQWARFDFKPYFILLGIAVVFIGIGSFFSDLQSYYPRYNRSYGPEYAAAHGISEWVTMTIFELCYGSDFIAVEVFFRGFLIHAFVRTLGGYAVLAMVGTYVVVHFGKPITETISSCFGGYLLGIISYNTKSVWGGIVVHIGVAWSMELFGYLQKIL